MDGRSKNGSPLKMFLHFIPEHWKMDGRSNKGISIGRVD
jgi:hypothetical protein